MKKLSLYIFLGLLWCNVGFADILPLDFKIERQLNNYPCFNELPVKKYEELGNGRFQFHIMVYVIVISRPFFIFKPNLLDL